MKVIFLIKLMYNLLFMYANVLFFLLKNTEMKFKILKFNKYYTECFMKLGSYLIPILSPAVYCGFV